jgi:tRNA pseudouridine13 synthase
LSVPKIERLIGIEAYGTNSYGIGGIIRFFPKDFVVNEVLVDGSKANKNQMQGEVLGSSKIKTRYLMCVFVKKNWDTFLALKKVTKRLRINSKKLRIAGIKDAKAITSQFVTIEEVVPEAVKKIQIKDLQIIPIGYVREKVSSYYLLGNQFQINIRGINYQKQTIRKRVLKTIEEVEEKGLPNFFGHQRFGTIRPLTHLVGKALIQNNFKKGIMIYLTQLSSDEHPQSREARKKLEITQDFKQALKDFPEKLYYERLILEHLAIKPGDFIGAFKKLPFNLQRLFPQAYQSYLFNKVLSQRILNGVSLKRAEVGDYVVNIERSGLPIFLTCKKASLNTLPDINKAIKDEKMKIVIPLIDFKHKTAKDFRGEIESKILEEEGLQPESFRIKKMPEITVKKRFRTAVATINDFSIDKVTKDETDPLKKKTTIRFMLHRGSYATIMLREIMKPKKLIKAGF